MIRANYNQLVDDTKRSIRYRLKERAIKAYNRYMEDDMTDSERVATAQIWRGRNVVLFDANGNYLAEYRWYPNQNRLRRVGDD